MASGSGGQGQLRYRVPTVHTGARLFQTGGTASGKFPYWGICIICNNTGNSDVSYDDLDFFVLPCLHTICSDGCLTRLGEFDPLACPKCKVKFTSEGVTKRPIRPMDILDKEKVEAEASVVNVVICTYCFRGDEGVTWCTNCEEFLCQNCTDHHPHAKSTHDHTLSKDLQNRKKSDSVDAVGNSSEGQKGCPAHKGQDQTTFCETCEIKLCNLCISSDHVHAEHKLSGIPQLLEEFKKELEKTMKEAYMMAKVSKQAEADIREKINHVLKTEKEYLLNEAGAQFSILLSTLMNREMGMRKEITELTVTRAKLLNIKRAKLKSIILQATQYSRIARDVACRTSDESLLKIRSMMKSQFQKLRTTSNIIMEKSNYSSYCEQGNHFLMEKAVCSSAERHLNSVGKCTYAYNPNSRVHQKMYKNVECIKRSASIAQAQAAASAAIAAATATRPAQVPQNAPIRSRPSVTAMPINPSVGRSQSNITVRPGASIQSQKVVPTAVVNGRIERPQQVARRSVAMKRTSSQTPHISIRSPPIAKIREQQNLEYDQPVAVNNADQFNEMEDENETEESYELFTMEAVEVDEEEDVSNSVSFAENDAEDADSTALQIDEEHIGEEEEEPAEVNAVYLPFENPETEIGQREDNVQEMYIDESSTEEKNDAETETSVEVEKTLTADLEESETDSSTEAVKIVEESNIRQEEDEEVPLVVIEESDMKHEKDEEVPVGVMGENEDGLSELLLEAVHGPTIPVVEEEEEDDDGPPLLTAPTPIPHQGRRTSRKAQLSAELRTEDEAISFEEDAGTTVSDKTLPELTANTNALVRDSSPTNAAAMSDLSKEIEVTLEDSDDSNAMDEVTENPNDLTNADLESEETTVETLTSPGSDVQPPVISPYSDPDLTLSGKRERKVKKIDPEFVDPDDSSLKVFRRKPSLLKRDPSPSKPSTSKSAGVGEYVVGEEDSSASSSYSSENLKTKKAKKRSSGFLGRTNRKRKYAKKTIAGIGVSLTPPDEVQGTGSITPYEEHVIKFPMLRDENMKFTNTDDNEDYCAVCRDGGEDIMICCDNCPKVFHLKCHIPAVDDVPPDDWQCNYCKSKADACKVPPPNPNMPDGDPVTKFTKGIMQKPLQFHTACKLLCEVFKLDECLSMRVALESITRSVKVDPGLNLHKIRIRLTSGLPKPFSDARQLIITLRKMIKVINNHAPVITEEYAWITRFQEKFDSLVRDYFPEHQGLTHDSPNAYA